MLQIERTPFGNVSPSEVGELLKLAQDELAVWLYDKTQGLVQSGPFEGMKLLRQTAWKETRLAPMLLGSYEEELHGALEHQIARLKTHPKPKIVVVGAAEGYYAIGLARRLPNAQVFIIEPDENAVELCGLAAANNGVSLVVGAPVSVVLDQPDLIFMDCEGHEVEYLDLERCPCLTGVHAIVEVHNFKEQKTDDILLERFRSSHRITMLFEAARNPNRFPMLGPLPSDYRWMAMSEGRPCLMGWFVMEPRGLFLA